jgi:tRNA G10  N-methylase Trm11
VVLTPFLGIGSELFTALKMGRKGIGAELKGSYYRQAAANLKAVEAEQQGALFDDLNHEAAD